MRRKTKRYDNDLTSVTNVSNKYRKEDKRITANKEGGEKQSKTSDNNSNSSSESKIYNNMTFGNELTQKKKDITRILYSNVRGLELSTESHTLEILCNFILKHDVDICGMAETNTHWKHPKGKKKIKSMTHRYWRRDSIVTSESDLPWNCVHKPGGTGMILRQPIKHSITNEGEDSFNMGRWSYRIIRGRNKKE